MWKQVEDEKPIEFLLEDLTVFVLHPADEVPKVRTKEETCLSQFQHEVPKIDDKSLSLSLVFRTVTSKEAFSTKSNKMVLFDDKLDSLFRENKFHTGVVKANHLHHDDAKEEWRRQEKRFKKNWTLQNSKKPKEWGLVDDDGEIIEENLKSMKGVGCNVEKTNHVEIGILQK